ncbi:MAG: cytidine deaminase [Tyzzerella sp.]|uniref:Cytidine deaminase n=1 Tax=Candidatus Fimicola merdigallinarum TaxID=2840819 RepID=A0A9D9DYX2_9FIRM|nr:cytidine deaminase [Candidatus Fimicola merdigallinarum]
MDNRQLIEKAKEAMENSYSPYSNFKVGACLLCKDGTIYTGCNIENSSFGATNCAERTAIFKAVSEGKREFLKIAVVGSGEDLTFPCGICRQVMSEFMLDGEVILEDNNREIKVFKVRDLLPYAFSL